MECITSRQNPLFQKLRKLNGSSAFRRQQGLFVCEGPKLLEEAVKWGADIQIAVKTPAFSLPRGLSCRVVETPEAVLDSIADTETPQGVVFACALPDAILPERLPQGRYLVLDGVQDPGNLGTVWRTADAFGAAGREGAVGGFGYPALRHRSAAGYGGCAGDGPVPGRRGHRQ